MNRCQTFALNGFKLRPAIEVISTVMAQTVALEHHESKVDNMIETFSKINKATEEHGSMNINKKELFKLVAENNNTNANLVVRVKLFGRSDTAWQHAEYDAVLNGRGPPYTR